MTVVLDPLTALPARTARVLIAADVRDLGAIIGVLAALPERTRGQVFVEAQSADDIEAIVTPELVTLSWLVRDDRTGAPGTGESCRPGVALGRAVRAWIGEMTTGDSEADGGEVVVWILGDAEPTATLRDELVERLGTAHSASAA